jgi:hypothetical protein
VLGVSVLVAALLASGCTHDTTHAADLDVTPSTTHAGGSIQVAWTGAPGQEPVSGVAATLQANRSGRWVTLYTLFVQRPGQSGPPYVAGLAGNLTTIGITDPATFVIPPVPAGVYRLERPYSYGPSGKRSQVKAHASVTIR